MLSFIILEMPPKKHMEHYLRVVNADSNIHCALVMAKSISAPIQSMTMPRLELSAAVVAMNMDSLLNRELRLSLEVSRLFRNIHEGSGPVQWGYVGTKQNPTDYASRGLSAKAMLEDTKWSHGPEFLWQNEHSWPEFPIDNPRAQPP